MLITGKATLFLMWLLQTSRAGNTIDYLKKGNKYIYMKEYDFALIATSKQKLDAEEVCRIADNLFDAGADDCTVSLSGNTLIIEFDRESETYKDAVTSAIRQVNSIKELNVKSVDAGQWVGLSDAAELSDLTRSALSKFSKGERGDGKFPAPYLRVSGKTPLYDWSEVASWLHEKALIDPEVVDNAKTTSKINVALRFNSDELKEIISITEELVIK